MSSPPEQKGVRGLLEPFSRTRSHSPSQPSLQHVRTAAFTTAESSEGTTLTTSLIATRDSLPYRSEDTSVNLADYSPVLPARQDVTPTGPEPSNTPPVTTIIAGHGEVVAKPTQVYEGRGVVWNTLRESLRSLGDSLKYFPPLSSSVESLLSCLGTLGVTKQNRQYFEDLSTELAALTQLLNPDKTMGSTPISMCNSTMRISMAIEREANEIRDKLGTAQGSSEGGASVDEEELITHYRRIQDCFRQLHINVKMGAWSMENEHLANTRLEGLSPAKPAAHDSSLSTETNRRNCTEGTRTTVLDGLNDWFEGPATSSIYWMNGMAGTGKTTIASTFCERIERRKLLAASFFCTRNSAECRNVARIIPTIAYQLAQYSIPFQSALCQALGQNPGIGPKNILRQFEQLLKEPLQQVKKSHAMPSNLLVVIDALDECDDQNGVELVLDMLFRHAAQLPLKFLVTSRPEPEIYAKMSAHPQFREVLHLHEIEKSLVRADIELYLRGELGFMHPPASQAQVEQLAQRSGTLFIYAATLVRYISCKRFVDSHKRLRAVLELAPESTKRHAQIDGLYAAVLKSALSEDGVGEDEVQDIRAVLRVALLAQEPISVETIARLAEVEGSRVVRALQPLRSVLHQSEGTGLVSALHASFPDFMFNKERSRSYFCDIVEHSLSLTWRCFLVMKEQLRFNICNLASSFLPDGEVEGLQERIKENISRTLAYACRYWASHLSLAPRSDTLLMELDEFVSNRLLFWMEVLSLRRELSMGVDGLLKAQRWLTHVEYSSSNLMIFVDDARSFVTGFAVNPVSQSTPHIYISSLAFCPRSNSIHKCYGKRANGLMKLTGSLMERREAAPLAIWASGSPIQSLALSPDGTRIVIGCVDATISILSAYDGTVYVGPLRGHSSSVESVAFSPEGGRIASASLGGIRVWNAYNGNLIAGPFKGHMRYINSVFFSPDGARIISGGHDSTIRIWNGYDGTQLLGPLTDHTDLVLRVLFSPDGSLFASASTDCTIRLWDAQDGTPVAPPFYIGRVDSLVFTPDGSRIISGSRDNIRVWEIPDGSPIIIHFESYSGGVNSLAVSLDGTRVAAGCDDHAVRVWKITDGKLIAGPFFGHTDSIKSVAYSPDGTRVISCSSDRTIHVWNVRDGMFPPPPPPPQNAVVAIKTVTFCPDNIHFLSSDGFGIIRIWDTSDGSFTTAPDKGVFFPTPLSHLSPDGCCIASNSEDHGLQIMSTTNGSRIAGPFEIDRASLSTFGFSHNSKVIMMGCFDGTIKICDLRRPAAVVGSFTGHHKGVRSLTESPDCSLLVSYSDYENVLRVWNIVTPALDLELFNPPPESTSGHSHAAVYDGWHIREDGWTVNNSQHLLFWLPPDLALGWCSPYATLVITKSGTLQVPRQKPLIGDHWADCYRAE